MKGRTARNHHSGARERSPQDNSAHGTANDHRTTNPHYGEETYSSGSSNPPRDIKKYTLFKIPLRIPAREYPPPFPDRYNARHDGQSGFIRMPCSPSERVPTASNGSRGFLNMGSRPAALWDEILKACKKNKKIENVHDFDSVVRSYNPDAADGTHGFSGLDNCLKHMRHTDEVERFFKMDIVDIMRMSSPLDTVVTSALPLLRAGNNTSVSLSQYQAASLLANAFMCTFPMRNGTSKSSGGTTYPDFNFDRLFERAPDASREAQKTEKLRCILNYFRRVAAVPPKGTLTITRRNARSKNKDWWRSRETNILGEVHITSTSSIQDAGEDMVQIDFANKYIGGGVLGNGLVQEEIRFLQFPEMIVSRLLCERLEDDEAILIIGAERYNETEGYARTFKWKANFSDNTLMDKFRRKKCQVVAMDAMDFGRDRKSQYQMRNILRELNKALVGFSPFSNEPSIGGEHLSGVATGNWGCGVFGGDPRLKFLIQLMAVSEASRQKMVYCSYHDKTLAKDLQSMHKLMVQKKLTVGQLFNILERYSEESSDKDEAVFTFVSKHLGEENKGQSGGEQTCSEKTRTVSKRQSSYDDSSHERQRTLSSSANVVQQSVVVMDNEDSNHPSKSDDGICTSGQPKQDQNSLEQGHCQAFKKDEQDEAQPATRNGMDDGTMTQQ